MNLRCLFAVTAFAVIACASLSFPSVAWVLLFSLGHIALAIFAVQNAITVPNRKPFWLSYLAGVAMFYLVDFNLDPVADLYISPLWELFHGLTSPFGDDEATANQMFESNRLFARSVELLLMFALPFVFALAVSFATGYRRALSP